jgi:Domain of unknown function (DUF5122) beta-propeller
VVLKDSTEYSNAIAIQPDGKIVVAEHLYLGYQANFVVVRYQTNGDFDSSFGNNGKVVVYFSQAATAYPKSVIILSDGRILVGGISR